MTPRQIKAEIVRKNNLAGDYWLVVLKLKKRMDFVAGQYVSVLVDDSGMRRAYSVASLPDADTIELLVDVAPMGLGSKFFLKSEVGQEIDILGPLGRFVVSNPNEVGQMPILFVTTGSGIAPEKSMIESLLASGYKGRLLLVWGMRYEEDLFWQDRFEIMEKEHVNFGYRLVLSQPSDDWGGERGHVGDVLGQLEMAQWAGAYLCGNQKMIEEVREQLVSAGMPSEKIYWERFD